MTDPIEADEHTRTPAQTARAHAEGLPDGEVKDALIACAEAWEAAQWRPIEDAPTSQPVKIWTTYGPVIAKLFHDGWFAIVAGEAHRVVPSMPFYQGVSHLPPPGDTP